MNQSLDSVDTDKGLDKELQYFHQNHFPLEFTCPHEERIGGMKKGGGKWFCSPSNMKKYSKKRKENGGNGCMIYSSLFNFNRFQLEKALQERFGGSSSCEIHVFNPNHSNEVKNIPDGITYHEWGFKASTDYRQMSNMKSIQETVIMLKHEGLTIDLMMLDCLGCEYDIYNDILERYHTGIKSYDPPIFMQVLIKVQAPPSMESGFEFFTTFQNKNYVSFHKSSSSGSLGYVQDYGFLRLSNDFFI